MKIVTRDELCEYPNGTVFMTYEPDCTDGNIHIKTGYMNDTIWNGELELRPFWEFDSQDIERFCQWCTTDTATCDYKPDQQFMVFSKTEVQQMINALMWALTGCKSNFNEDIWICGDTILTDQEFYSGD